DPEVDPRLYEIAGFKVAGKRAVRVDILERLADIIRPLIALDAGRPYAGELPAGAAEGNGFRVTVEMTSLLGCSGEDFASILSSLGYRLRRTPKVAAPVEAVAATDAAPAEEAVSTEAPAAEAVAEDAPVVAEAAPETVVAEEAAPAAEEAAPATDASAEVEAASAEPEFDEIWFPGGRRQNEQRRHEPRRRDAANADAPARERRNDRQRPKGPTRPEGSARPEGAERPRNTRPANTR